MKLAGTFGSQVVRDLGTADVDARLEELLIDGILYAFQEQVCWPGSCVIAYLMVLPVAFPPATC